MKASDGVGSTAGGPGHALGVVMTHLLTLSQVKCVNNSNPDTNVAYGRSVTYSGSNGNEQTNDMTDGLSTVDDSICPGVMKPSQSSAYLEVDLGAAYQVNYVNIYFKGIWLLK